MTMTKKLHSCQNVIICQHLLPLIEFVFVLRRRDSAMVKPSQTSTKCQFIVPSSSFECRHHHRRNSFYPLTSFVIVIDVVVIHPHDQIRYCCDLNDFPSLSNNDHQVTIPPQFSTEL